MEQMITLALICIFGPVAALIVLTLFFYLLNIVDDWLTDRKYRKAMREMKSRTQASVDKLRNQPPRP